MGRGEIKPRRSLIIERAFKGERLWPRKKS
jgi:hypothetical protein